MENKLHVERVQVGQLDIRYFTGGNGEPFIIVHGGGDGALAWLEIARQLASQYTVYVPDLPGFGQSQSISNRFELPEFINFIEDFAKSLNLENFYILGHSLGGSISLHYALEYPHRIKKLVVLSSFGLGKDIALWIRILSSPFFIKLFGGVAVFTLKLVRSIGALFHSPLKSINPLPKVKIDIGRKITTFKGQNNILTSRLAELVMPTLLIWGDKDGIVPSRHAYYAAQLIPECEVKIFRNCGHVIQRQMVPELIYTVTDFINRGNLE